MNRSIFLGLVLTIAAAGNAHASNLAVITNPPNMIHLLVLAGAVFGSVASFKVLESVRGGMLSRCWQMLAFGFVVLAIAQLLRILSQIEVIFIPSFVVPAAWAVMAGLFAYGIWEAKRNLS